MTTEQKAEADRIAARIRELRAERPPSKFGEAFGELMSPEKFGEIMAAMPEANRERIFRQFPQLRPKP